MIEIQILKLRIVWKQHKFIYIKSWELYGSIRFYVCLKIFSSKRDRSPQKQDFSEDIIEKWDRVEDFDK